MTKQQVCDVLGKHTYWYNGGFAEDASHGGQHPKAAGKWEGPAFMMAVFFDADGVVIDKQGRDLYPEAWNFWRHWLQ